MDSLDHATLRAEERLVLERFVDVLRLRLGDALGAVWLFYAALEIAQDDARAAVAAADGIIVAVAAMLEGLRPA